MVRALAAGSLPMSVHLILFLWVWKCGASVCPSLPEGAEEQLDGLVPRQVLDGWLYSVWEGRQGHGSTDEEKAVAAKASGENAATYGEIMPEEFREVASWMRLGKADVFMDMGSGVGRTVREEFCPGVPTVNLWYLPTLMTPDTSSVTNLLCRALSELADLLHSLHPELPAGSVQGLGGSACAYTDSLGDRRVSLTEGDLFEQDLSQVTALWISSLCFGEHFLQRLRHRLASAAPRLRRIALLKRWEGELEGFEQQPSLFLPMSWTKNVFTADSNFLSRVEVYLFSRRDTPTAASAQTAAAADASRHQSDA